MNVLKISQIKQIHRGPSILKENHVFLKWREEQSITLRRQF